MLNSVLTPSQHSIPVTLVMPLAQPHVIAECGPYRARLATTDAERHAAFRLRFMVFNLELEEGLDSAYETGFDTDHFDDVCDHLIVEDTRTGAVVGTYRMQSGETAARNFGYYSEQEFDFTPYESMRSRIVELGRACVHRDHRTSEVLNLLWKGIMRYAVARGSRYLMGCCSLTSQCPREGSAVYESLLAYRIEPTLMTQPTATYAMPTLEDALLDEAEAPRLLRAYLAVGARICSSPAIDRCFKTIDFLTMIDLETMNPRIARRYL
ncbi:putative hemolysin [Terriglobus roseus DSM 18391]|uniref:Putative hemolysin n=1 Tax=Terriglobus roseus (strain DSM 18391 / NRRL B-41598 / KBS 63) TaxID=926566 RepID=I3ZLC2_TERRK|nr:GNAT family N-acyltransferase [Terriglobus roseus]AFL90040.1 putative hemolysin [Terriglobus roseus DSM 18391]